MNHLTEEMMRLCQEIGTSHRERKSFMNDMKREVARMKRANNHSFQAMAKSGKADRNEFVRGVKNSVSNMKKAVAEMRQAFADDIAGARQAWHGKNA